MSSPNLKRIAFLLGAGASLKAGMPSTDEITKGVLSGEVIKSNDSDRILIFLNWLKAKIDLFYFSRWPYNSTNYEDIYYIATQVHDSITGEFDNPAVQPLIDKILPQVRPLLIDEENTVEKQLGVLAGKATEYIEEVVYNLLRKDPRHFGSLDYLACIKDARSEISKVDIFTLNHDTVLEEFLKNDNEFTDGFHEPENKNKFKYKFWKPDLYEANSFKIRLFKLHGSVDWIPQKYDREDGTLEERARIVKPPFGEIYKIVDRNGNSLSRKAYGRPMFLIGTFNKMLKYSSWIFADLFSRFWLSLPSAERLVASGYSFGDKGINNAIIAWIYPSPECKMVVIDPAEEEKFRVKTRGAIGNKWDELKEKGKLIYMKNKIGKVSWEEIKEKLP